MWNLRGMEASRVKLRESTSEARIKVPNNTLCAFSLAAVLIIVQ
jgi:hypothetical protein